MTTSVSTDAPPPGALARFFAGDVWHSFKHSPVAIVSSVLVLICGISAAFAPWVAPKMNKVGFKFFLAKFKD